MRTTVTIDDAVYEAARRIAFEERRTLGDVMNDLLTVGLAARATGQRRTLGAFQGRIWISDDFDEPLAEFEASIDEPL